MSTSNASQSNRGRIESPTNRRATKHGLAADAKHMMVDRADRPAGRRRKKKSDGDGWKEEEKKERKRGLDQILIRRESIMCTSKNQNQNQNQNQTANMNNRHGIIYKIVGDVHFPR